MKYNYMKPLIMLPGPTNIHEETLRSMQKPIINHRGKEFHDLYSNLQEKLKYVFQTDNDIFILSSSGTGGVEFGVINFIEKNDKVVVPVFGEFSERLYRAVLKICKQVIKIDYPYGTAPNYDDIKEIFDKYAQIDVFALVANETSTGVTAWDMEKMLKVSKDKGAINIVDSISILGGVDIPTDKWKIDVHITGSQKCLASPPGLALVSVSKDAIDKYDKNTEVYSSYFDLKPYMDFHLKKETPYTPAVPLFYALDTSLELIRNEGLYNVFNRHKKCSDLFYQHAHNIGLEIYPRNEDKSVTVIALKTPRGLKASEITKSIKENFNIDIAAGFGKIKEDIIRIGCMGIINDDMVEYTMEKLSFTIEKMQKL